MAQRSLDPQDWSVARAQGHKMLDDMFDHIEALREQPLWQPPAPHAKAALAEPLPQAPGDLAQVHQAFLETILPYSSGNAHPGFMGWVQGGGNVAGMLAEMLAAGLNANLGGRDHMAVVVERQVTAWTAEMVGFPADATGIFLTGASQANFVAALIARTRALGPEVRADGLQAGGPSLTAYASDAVHGCVARALEMAGLGSRALRLIPTDAQHRIDLGALKAAIAADRAAGFAPFLLVGTAGTVDVGAIDDLTALADVAAAQDMHFHIDGALGALGVLAPGVAPRLAGIERADSLAFDWHKWGQAPYDAGFLLVRDPQLNRSTFAAEVRYLSRAARGLAAGEDWPCDYGPDLSRGFRALKVWFALKTYGAAALGAVIDQTCALAQALAQRIAAEPELELMAPVALNIVCFRYRAGEVSDAVNGEIVMRLHEAGRVAPSLTRIEGHAAIRAAIVNHRTEDQDIAALVEATLTQGRQCLRQTVA